MNLSELLKFTIYPNTGYNGVEGYDYSRVFDNGVHVVFLSMRLLSLLTMQI